MIQRRNPDGRRRQEPANRLWPFDAADASPVCSYNEWNRPRRASAASWTGPRGPAGAPPAPAPMPWRSRYFEIDAYRPLLTDYFRRGARWISAPKPQLLEDWYDAGYDRQRPCESGRYLTLEHEPTFDAADFIRCGRDIFVQRSHVTNRLGIEWVARHLGGEYRITQIDVADPAPMHIDASFMPLAPGKLLVNPKRVRSIPAMFDSWEVRCAPEPALPAGHLLYMSSPWVSMNVFMLDQDRVVVEAGGRTGLQALADTGADSLTVVVLHEIELGRAL